MRQARWVSTVAFCVLLGAALGAVVSAYAAGPVINYTYDGSGNLIGVFDVSSDVNNCGRPGNACPSIPNGRIACTAGVCGGGLVCNPGCVASGGQCLDLTSDPANCGAVGNACQAPTNGSTSCVIGACVAACPTGYSLVGGGCFDLGSDPANCGTVGHVCGGATDGSGCCVQGLCSLVVGGSCVDVASDPSNCGAVGTVCPSPANGAAACVDGVCGIRCSAGYAPSGNQCIDVTSDPANCGAVGNVCPGTPACCADALCGLGDASQCSVSDVPTVTTLNGVAAPGVRFDSPLWAGITISGSILDKVTYVEVEDWGSDTVGGQSDAPQSYPAFTGVVCPSSGVVPIAFGRAATTLTLSSLDLQDEWNYDPSFNWREWYKVRLHFANGQADAYTLVDVAVSLDDQLPEVDAPAPRIDAVDVYRAVNVYQYDAGTGFLETSDFTTASPAPTAVLAKDFTEYPILSITEQGVYIAASLDPSQFETPWSEGSRASFVFPYTNAADDAVDLTQGGVILRGSDLSKDGPLILSNPVGTALSGDLATAVFLGDRIVISSVECPSPVAYVEFDSYRGTASTPWPLNWAYNGSTCYCRPSCPAGACGVVADGCGGTISCGCSEGQECTSSNVCCQPTCPANACGTSPDGCGGALTCPCTPPTVPVFDTLPDVLPPNLPSQPFQAQQTAEFGDEIELAPGTGRYPVRATVVMSTWSTEAYSHPITLNLYSVYGETLVPLGTRTQTFDIPARPTGDPTCPDAGYGPGFAWRASDGRCYNGLVFTITFDLSGLNVLLPDSLAYGVAYDTESWGYAPLGQDGPYDSLNVGVIGDGSTASSTQPSVGTDPDPDALLRNYWNFSATPPGYTGFQKETGWTGFAPAVEFLAY